MSDESLIGGDAAPTTTGKGPLPGPANPFGTPAAPSPTTGTHTATATSIVDTILNLDELLSADVRRAEKTARFYLRPDLEATIDDLTAQLELLTDSAGNPLPLPDGALDDARTAKAIAAEIAEVIAEFGASAQSVRFRQLPDDEWQEFLARHKGSDKPGEPRPPEFWNDLIAAAAVAPPMTVAQVGALRKKLGTPQMTILGNAAFEVNAYSGVSIPKSLLSSHVLKQGQRGTS